MPKPLSFSHSSRSVVKSDPEKQQPRPAPGQFYRLVIVDYIGQWIVVGLSGY